MSEALALAPSINPEANQSPTGMEKLIHARHEFTDKLVEKGLISEEFVRSGALQMFALDAKSGRDGLSHMLVGDLSGGAHHLPTILEMEARTIVYTKLERINSFLEAKARHSVQPTGEFYANGIKIKGRPGKRRGKYFTKLNGSSFFPNEWTTEDVLRSALTVLRTSPGRKISDKNEYNHQGYVNGVAIRVVANNNGRILSAFPLVGSRV